MNTRRKTAVAGGPQQLWLFQTQYPAPAAARARPKTRRAPQKPKVQPKATAKRTVAKRAPSSFEALGRQAESLGIAMVVAAFVFAACFAA